MELTVLCLSFVVFLLLGVPVAFAIGLSCLATFAVEGLPFETAIQMMVSGMNVFSFLAIPFFIFAGELMMYGGIADKIVDFAKAAVGHIRGGLGMSNVLACTLFGGVSGSPVADVSAMGAVMIPMMKKEGYHADYAVNVTTHAALVGALMPTSHNMIIYTLAAGGKVSIAKLILADLQAAAGLLPTAPRNGQKGRATSWTARAYKGRVLAYTHQYPLAIATFDSVIASGPYALELSFDRVWTGFHQFADGPETILAFQSSVNDGEPNGNNSNYGERLNLPHSGSPFKCCGFHQPSQNLANFYAVNSVSGLPKPFTDSATWNNRDSVWVASPTDTVDPRLDWTIGRRFVPYKDWGMEDSTWIRAPGYGGPYSPKKNAQEKASGAVSKVGWQPEQENGVHIHIFRYADLLLLDAEAKVETNDLAGALTLVNLVRNRAAVAAQGCGAGSSNVPLRTRYPLCNGDDRMAVPINDPTIKWATYKVSPYTAADFATQAAARQAVRIERRLELSMEGQRLFDLRRYGGAFATATMTAYLTKEATPARRAYKTAQTPFATPLNDFYPIPTVEIDLSVVGGVKRLNQNPGW